MNFLCISIMLLSLCTYRTHSCLFAKQYLSTTLETWDPSALRQGSVMQWELTPPKVTSPDEPNVLSGSSAGRCMSKATCHDMSCSFESVCVTLRQPQIPRSKEQSSGRTTASCGLTKTDRNLYHQNCFLNHNSNFMLQYLWLDSKATSSKCCKYFCFFHSQLYLLLHCPSWKETSSTEITPLALFGPHIPSNTTWNHETRSHCKPLFLSFRFIYYFFIFHLLIERVNEAKVNIWACHKRRTCNKVTITVTIDNVLF